MDEAYKHDLLGLFNEALDEENLVLWSPSTFGGGFAYRPMDNERTMWACQDGSVIKANLEEMLIGWVIGEKKWKSFGEDGTYPWEVLSQFIIEKAYIPQWA
jgi:hypothetical protein